jgi:N-acyl-D-amino-acid deacylase
MRYDLMIKNGTVIDGSGMPRYRADVGISGGKIAAVGRLGESAKEVIDAEERVVAPGFVDGHTHMDAQISWDPLGTCSCYHGVTSVIMGNCGFTLAPVRKDAVDLVLYNLERAEDIPMAAMREGVDLAWETFPEFLDAVEALPKGINYGGYIGHSALRTYVMGERAFSEKATSEDLEQMAREVKDAVRAGAMGFSTSRAATHMLPDGRPVASRMAHWEEVKAIVSAMGGMNAGIFEIAGEATGRDPERIRDYQERLKALAVESGRPITWGMFASRRAPDLWRSYMDLLDETAAAGGRMFAQVHSRSINVLYSFMTRMPFDRLPEWRSLRDLGLEEKEAALRDAERRAGLVAAAATLEGRDLPVDYEWLFVMDTVGGPHPTVADLARQRGVHPAEVIIDEALERHLALFFISPFANELEEPALELMKHPRSVVTFSDSGAHVSQIMDSSLQTYVFSHWVREKRALSLERAVRMVTFETASAWELPDRGLLRPGFAADVVVFDPDELVPTYPVVVDDLPGGARRLVQKADGILATVVNGEVLMRDGEHTGALPGQLLRGPLARGVRP